MAANNDVSSNLFDDGELLAAAPGKAFLVAIYSISINNREKTRINACSRILVLIFKLQNGDYKPNIPKLNIKDNDSILSIIYRPHIGLIWLCSSNRKNKKIDDHINDKFYFQ